LGEASYGLYILHMPLLSLVRNLGLLSPGWGDWPAFLAGAVVCVTASLLSLRFVETPCRRAIRAWLAPASPWPQDRATCVREARVEDLAPRMVG
jgi:peptidoglycan/LPS O-acetylase OafA/YrhL